MKAPVHPDVFLASLLERGSRAQRVRNLKLIHAICGAERKGGRDFSIGNIGRHSEAASGLSAKALYNQPSRDYRDLIEVWKNYVLAMDGREPKKESVVPTDILSSIPDPALRILMRQIIIERDRLKVELNMLKSHTTLRIVRKVDQSEPELAGAVEVTPRGDLDPGELAALAESISADFLEDQGLCRDPRGALTNVHGRMVYPPAYVRAIEKILAR